MATTDPKLRKAIFKAHKGKCFYSGRTLDPKNFHIDHVMPDAAGGAWHHDNYVPCCPIINVQKSDSYNAELVERMHFIIKTVYSPKVERIMKTMRREKKVWPNRKHVDARSIIRSAINAHKAGWPSHLTKEWAVGYLVKEGLPLTPRVMSGLTVKQRSVWSEMPFN